MGSFSYFLFHFREYLCKNENIFENILGYCSRAQVLSIHAEYQSSIISFFSPFKGTEAWDFWPLFFSWINSPWIHMLKYFQKYFCFRRDIHEIRFFHGDFWVTVPGNQYKKTLFCEYLCKNENIFENILGGYSRDLVLLIHEKNQSLKISW